MVAPARSMKDTLTDGMYRPSDPQASRDAAKIVVPYITEIQAKVLARVREAGKSGAPNVVWASCARERGASRPSLVSLCLARTGVVPIGSATATPRPARSAP